MHRFCTPTRLRIRRRWHASWQLRGGLVLTVELVGIGMGPGDPDLLTIAAVRELSSAGRVMAPDMAGRAEVVRAHAASATGLTLVEGVESLTLLPLSRDLAALDDALARGGTVSTVVVLSPRNGRGAQL